MKKLRIVRNFLLPGLLLCSTTGSFAAGTNSLSVTATVISKNICTFNTANSTLAFGALNPASTADATASTSVVIRCRGSSPIASFLISHNSGRYETAPGANRLRNTAVTTEFLPYTLTINPATALIPKNTNTTITISGSITASNYQNAYVGNYRDRVVLTLVP